MTTPWRPWEFSENWLLPSAVVPVDMPTTLALLNEVRRLRASRSEIAGSGEVDFLRRIRELLAPLDQRTPRVIEALDAIGDRLIDLGTSRSAIGTSAYAAPVVTNQDIHAVKPPSDKPREGYDQAALDEASRQLHMFFLREGSRYGTVACEEIGRVFMTAYLNASRSSVVTCENCAFRYGAEHVKEGSTPEAECPVCAEQELLARLSARVEREALKLARAWMEEEGERSFKEVLRIEREYSESRIGTAHHPRFVAMVRAVESALEPESYVPEGS